MEFYFKAEPAGEFATGIIKNGNYNLSDICDIQIDESPKNDVVRTFGIPIYLDTTKDNLEQIKETILNNFINMPNNNRDKINWNIDYREPSKNICEDEDGNELLNENDLKYFSYIEYSKYSVDMDFGNDIDLSKLTITIAFIEFHVPIEPGDIQTMWVLECIEYYDEDAEEYGPEWEPIDRGIDIDCKLHDCDFDAIDIE